MIMKKLLLPLLVGTTLTMASDLYTDTYMSGSGIVYPHIPTGIPNTINGETLMHKRVVMSRSIYFEGGQLSKASADALEELYRKIAAHGSQMYYISLIGHTSSFTDEYHFSSLNAWSRFWQNIGKKEMKRDELAATVNKRIQSVYDTLTQNHVSASHIYTENRMDRDPIATEETTQGLLRNNRVDVTLYY